MSAAKTKTKTFKFVTTIEVLVAGDINMEWLTDEE